MDVHCAHEFVKGEKYNCLNARILPFHTEELSLEQLDMLVKVCTSWDGFDARRSELIVAGHAAKAVLCKCSDVFRDLHVLSGSPVPLIPDFEPAPPADAAAPEPYYPKENIEHLDALSTGPGPCKRQKIARPFAPRAADFELLQDMARAGAFLLKKRTLRLLHQRAREWGIASARGTPWKLSSAWEANKFSAAAALCLAMGISARIMEKEPQVQAYMKDKTVKDVFLKDEEHDDDDDDDDDSDDSDDKKKDDSDDDSDDSDDSDDKKKDDSDDDSDDSDDDSNDDDDDDDDDDSDDA